MSHPMTDPYVNGRLMLTKNWGYNVGKCGSILMAYMAYGSVMAIVSCKNGNPLGSATDWAFQEVSLRQMLGTFCAQDGMANVCLFGG